MRGSSAQDVAHSVGSSALLACTMALPAVICAAMGRGLWLGHTWQHNMIQLAMLHQGTCRLHSYRAAAQPTTIQLVMPHHAARLDIISHQISGGLRRAAESFASGVGPYMYNDATGILQYYANKSDLWFDVAAYRLWLCHMMWWH